MLPITFACWYGETVERPCYKCGMPVDENQPFCPECHAPQIRVSVAEDQPATEPLTPGTPGDVQPPATPVALAEQINWRDAFPGAISAAVFVAVCWVIPFVMLLAIAVFGGMLSVLLYNRRHRGTHLTTASGGKIGALTGTGGFALFTVLLAGAGSSLRNTLQQAIAQAAARNNDPRAQEMMQRLSSPEMLGALLVVMVIFAFAVLVGCSSLGGAIAARLLRRRDE